MPCPPRPTACALVLCAGLSWLAAPAARAEEAQVAPAPAPAAPGAPQPGYAAPPQPAYAAPPQPAYAAPPPPAYPGAVVIPAVPTTLVPPAPPLLPEAPLRTEHRVRWPLVGAGIGMLGGMYLLTALSAAGLESTTRTPKPTVWPLYVPVVGPFIHLGFVSTPLERFGLAFDGLVQGGGLAMIIAGVVAKKPTQVYLRRVSFLPGAVGSGSGVLALGSF